MNKDTAATVIGGILTAATAAQPVINGVQGSLHQQDYVQLAVAICMALFGWFSKIKSKGE